MSDCDLEDFVPVWVKDRGQWRPGFRRPETPGSQWVTVFFNFNYWFANPAEASPDRETIPLITVRDRVRSRDPALRGADRPVD